MDCGRHRRRAPDRRVDVSTGGMDDVSLDRSAAVSFESRGMNPVAPSWRSPDDTDRARPRHRPGAGLPTPAQHRDRRPHRGYGRRRAPCRSNFPRRTTWSPGSPPAIRNFGTSDGTDPASSGRHRGGCWGRAQQWSLAGRLICGHSAGQCHHPYRWRECEPVHRLGPVPACPCIPVLPIGAVEVRVCDREVVRPGPHIQIRPVRRRVRRVGERPGFTPGPFGRGAVAVRVRCAARPDGYATIRNRSRVTECPRPRAGGAHLTC
ncbi:conserved hypothetical protein (plasmid) [Rhodococcus jostii RHA1]|uniref:Uncharacterized protein n=1 Tax=Rhodococcus jostii (strain RHA1) TaxID=101510 RepID=Q0RXY7_RHOJR|nr:conserved hypothetical protein [Rhodococcus jostii RHA1]